jgi:hypothetical protein
MNLKRKVADTATSEKLKKRRWGLGISFPGLASF